MDENKLNKKFVKDVDLMFDVDTFSSHDDESFDRQYFDNVVYPVYERSNFINHESRLANID